MARVSGWPGLMLRRLTAPNALLASVSARRQGIEPAFLQRQIRCGQSAAGADAARRNQIAAEHLHLRLDKTPLLAQRAEMLTLPLIRALGGSDSWGSSQAGHWAGVRTRTFTCTGSPVNLPLMKLSICVARSSARAFRLHSRPISSSILPFIVIFSSFIGIRVSVPAARAG